MDAQWRTSSRSGGNGACVEARYAAHVAQVRDSKDPAGPVLSFPGGQWASFLTSVKAGMFDV